MLNQVVLVGRLVSDPEVKVTDNEKKVSDITLAVQRSYKNADGVYETDFIKCTLWNAIASSTADYCKKGDIVGVKGRLQCDSFEKENGEKAVSIRVVAEKITFLSSRQDIEKTDDRDDR